MTRAKYRDTCRCGAVFRSPSAEARHRHNFPMLCKPIKLSLPQKLALAKFGLDDVLSADRAKVRINTLRSLVRKGLLEDCTPVLSGVAFSPTIFRKPKP